MAGGENGGVSPAGAPHTAGGAQDCQEVMIKGAIFMSTALILLVHLTS